MVTGEYDKEHIRCGLDEVGGPDRPSVIISTEESQKSLSVSSSSDLTNHML